MANVCKQKQLSFDNTSTNHFSYRHQHVRFEGPLVYISSHMHSLLAVVQYIIVQYSITTLPSIAAPSVDGYIYI